jgi:hypothetical protein
MATAEHTAKMRATARMLAGFGTEEAPEALLVALVEALCEHDDAKADAIAEEAWAWVREWQRGEDE